MGKEEGEREGQRRKGRNCTESFGPSSKLLESRGHTQSAMADGQEASPPGKTCWNDDEVYTTLMMRRLVYLVSEAMGVLLKIVNSIIAS